MSRTTSRTTPASKPPERPSNEAEADQLRIAKDQGDAYGRALEAMAKEDGADVKAAGDYVVAFVNENAEGMYALEDGGLVWREAAEKANSHLEVAVADAGDGRFVPGLDVHIELAKDGERVLSTDLPFLWHSFLHHYGANAWVPDEGPYDVTIRIAPPTYMRHDPVNGKRYGQPVEVRFENVKVEIGRKPSPDAEPKGEPAPTAVASSA